MTEAKETEVNVMFCQNCGHEVKEGDAYCPFCGANLKDTHSGYTYFGNKTGNSNIDNDQGNVGYAILSFFLPLVGLILFLCWRKEKPKTAKQAGLGALSALAVWIILLIFIGVCIAL